MPPNEKFSAIRKGLLEFLILKIVAAGKVYVADILSQLSDTEFATQEGTLYPAPQQDAARRARRLRVAGVRRRAASQVLPADREGTAQLAELTDYWQHLNATIAQLGR